MKAVPVCDTTVLVTFGRPVNLSYVLFLIPKVGKKFCHPSLSLLLYKDSYLGKEVSIFMVLISRVSIS